MGTGKPRHPLVADIESFLAETGMTPTYFGNGAMRDPAFVFEARGGRDLRGTTEHKLRVQMAFYRRRGQFLDPASVSDRTRRGDKGGAMAQRATPGPPGQQREVTDPGSRNPGALTRR